MNKYDLEHVTTGHAMMSSDEWQDALPPRLRPLLFARAHRAHVPPRQGVRHQAGAPRQPRAAVLFHLPPGKGAPAAGRLLPPQAAPPAPLRPAAREPAGVLPAPAVGSRGNPRQSGRATTCSCTGSAKRSSATPRLMSTAHWSCRNWARTTHSQSRRPKSPPPSRLKRRTPSRTSPPPHRPRWRVRPHRPCRAATTGAGGCRRAAAR